MLCQQWWSVNKVFYKEATSSALNELLLAVPYLRANWKRIPSIIRLLSKIAKWNHDSKGWSSISYKKFLNAWGADYRRILEILRELGLLCIKRWVVTEDNKVKPNWRKKGTLGKEDKGHCYDFLLTPLCRARLGDHNKVYLHKLLTDKTERRKNQKRISRRGYNKLSYGDIRDNVKAMIDSSSYDEDAVNKVLETFIPMKREGVRYLLIQIAEKSYAPLKHNKKDNRLPNPYFELPPEIKELIKIKGLTSQYVGDIRSCYPSLWAAYVRGLILSKAKVGAPPIGYGNVDNEVERYNKFWLDPQIDPKKELSQLLDIPLDKVKDVVLKYYNGHTLTNDHYKRFDRWLQTEFPLLYRFWRKHTNIKETGNNIGKLFETPRKYFTAEQRWTNLYLIRPRNWEWCMRTKPMGFVSMLRTILWCRSSWTFLMPNVFKYWGFRWFLRRRKILITMCSPGFTVVSWNGLSSWWRTSTQNLNKSVDIVGRPITGIITTG